MFRQYLGILTTFAQDKTKMKKSKDTALKVNQGIEQPDALNQAAIERLRNFKQKQLSVSDYVDGIRRGDITMLSKAITLIESVLPAHQELAQEVIAACLPYSGNAVRVGITGVPGAGKSTFIEALGMHLVNKEQKIAVLAIDPSSQRSKGSILGDKTRMEQLATHPLAYIRPSASAGTLGGVARKTRESIILCEAAGFDVIVIETVGVGQSEIAVHAMVDFFLLVLISGAGDELQGIKRGIMEMADGIIINKADGDNILRAKRAKAECENALHLFPPAASGVKTNVLTCSAIEHQNIDTAWEMVKDYIHITKDNGFFERKRLDQTVDIMHSSIEDKLKSHFYDNPIIQSLLPQLEQDIINQKITSYIAANQLLNRYYTELGEAEK